MVLMNVVLLMSKIIYLFFVFPFLGGGIIKRHITYRTVDVKQSRKTTIGNIISLSLKETIVLA